MGSDGPQFVVYPDKAGEWRWRLLAANGEIQASGEGYTTAQHAEEGVKDVVKNCVALADLEGEVPQLLEGAIIVVQSETTA